MILTTFSIRMFFLLLGTIPLLRTAFGTSPPPHYHHHYSSIQPLSRCDWRDKKKDTSPFSILSSKGNSLPCFRSSLKARRGRNILLSFLQSDGVDTKLVGRRFTAEVSFVVGTQRILLHVPEKGRVDIFLTGIVSHTESARFRVMDDGTMNVTLSPQLNKKMSRYTCRMENPRYDEETDTAVVNVEVRLLGINKKIVLK